MLEIRPINSELAMCIQHALHGEVPFKRVCGVVLQHEHPVFQGWAVERAEHGFLGRRLIEVGIRGEDDVPLVVDLVHFGGPDVS